MAKAGGALDFVAIGRSSVDLYGQQIGGRLEDMASFAKYVGGSPTNTAIGAARLGLKAGLITRVGADHMGRFIRETLAREGIDLAGVVEDRERLTALAMLGIRDSERFPLIFFRENCADMALSTPDIDPRLIGRAAAVVLSGTHLSTASARAACLKAARLGKSGGAQVYLDVDYRPVLWGLTGRDRGEDRFVASAEVSAVLAEILPLCDVIVGTEEEMRIAGAGAGDLGDALGAIRARTEATLVCKHGAAGASAWPGAIQTDEEIVHHGFPVEVFNVLGAGDAFMAGLLRGRLRGMDWRASLEIANACGAIVVSRHGCAPAMPTWLEVERLRGIDAPPARLREDEDFEHLHWATAHGPAIDNLVVLAIDHRAQFERLAEEAGAPSSRIRDFKRLAVEAADRTPARGFRVGVILDGRHGGEALALAAEGPLWVARCIEAQGSRPLAFEDGGEVGGELTTWPAGQVVKCLLLAHPDDEASLRAAQEAALARLFRACRRTGHELLLELIPPGRAPPDGATIARLIGQIYALGVRPDWWKLQPFATPGDWRAIEAAIAAGDPLCRGVLLLGGGAEPAELRAAFAACADTPIVKGFAVGRTIFADVARRWLAGEVGDAAAVDSLSRRLSDLAAAWRAARAPERAA